MNSKPRESDWKIFRGRVPAWRERYLEKINREVLAIVTEGGRTPTERFWNAKEKMDEQAKVLASLLDDYSRSTMFRTLWSMHLQGFVVDEDLEEFSRELRDEICRVVGEMRR